MIAPLRAIWHSPNERTSAVAHRWLGKGEYSVWRSLCGQYRPYSELRTRFHGFPKCARCEQIQKGTPE